MAEPAARIATVPAGARAAGLGAALLAGALLALTPAAAENASPADAASMAAKIARIEATGAQARPPHAPPVTTAFTDREINAYLTLEGPKFLPPGIAGPRVTIGDGGRVTARAIVDLDAVRLAGSRGLFDPLTLLRGRLEVIASGFVEASNGRGLGRLESVTVAGVPVPKRVADELLRYYTRTPERPEGFGLDTPFDLPARIRGVSIAAGRCTVTQ
jgi:hypothetical protein